MRSPKTRRYRGSTCVFDKKNGFTAKEILSQLGCSTPHYIHKFAKCVRTDHGMENSHVGITMNIVD